MSWSQIMYTNRSQVTVTGDYHKPQSIVKENVKNMGVDNLPYYIRKLVQVFLVPV